MTRAAARKKPARKPSRKSPVKPRAKGAATASPPQTQRERVASKEDAIVGAAYELFAAQGFAKTTMSEIARRARVAEGTLYLYFNNKEALARAVLGAFYRRLTEAAQKGVEKRKTTRARLEFLARHHLENIIRERRLLELISTTDRNPETYEGSDIYRMNRAYVAVFDGVVRDGVWRGDIAGDAPLWISRDIFFGSLEYAMRTILMKRRANGKDIDAAVGALVSLLVAETGEKARCSEGVSGEDLNAIAGRFEAAAVRLERIAGPKRKTAKRKGETR